MSRSTVLVGSVAIVLLLSGGDRAQAQALLWNLPDEGTWVRYEGTFEQKELRPNDPDGDLEITWIRHLYIKSVGNKTAEYKGEQVPCRWIEIKSITGKPSEMGIDPGPVGSRIYKVLIPEKAVAGTVQNTEQIHVAYIPIVEGYRKIGNKPVEPINAKVLQVYPLISMLMHYKTLTAVSADPIDPEIPLQQDVLAREYEGVYDMESPTSRSHNKATLWRSDEVPFGLAKWKVEMDRYAKDAREPRDKFQHVTHIEVNMSAHEVDTGAESELAIPE
jgi:hypothetical protein